MRNQEEKKKKKEKIRYIDDGSTISDMSALDPYAKKKEANPYANYERPLPRWRQIINTYFDTVKIMLSPMLAFMMIIGVSFFLIWLIFSFLA